MARKSVFMQKVESVAIRERKREAAPKFDDPIVVREKSRERADKVRAPVSQYVHDRNMAKYLVIKFGRDEAARILDARNAIFRR